MKKIKAIVVTTNNEIKHVELDGSLESLQNAVGGYIEQLPGISIDYTCYGDEESKLKGKSPNMLATRLICDEVWIHPDYIAGDMLIVGGYDDKGEISGDVPDHVIENIERLKTKIEKGED